MQRTKKIFLDLMLAGVIFLLVLMMFALSSCKHQPQILPADLTGGNENPGGGTVGNENNCDPNVVFFEQQILPIIVSNCAKSGCHNSIDHEEDIVLNSYSSIMSDGEISAGNPGNSELYEVITETDPDDIMPPPPHSPLTSAQIALIRTWIQQGAQNNSCQNTCDTTNVTYSGSIIPILQNSCIGCHSGSTPGGNISLNTYAGVFTQATNGKLFGSVNHSTGFSAMPKGGNKLSTCQIDMIRIWIDAGAPNN